MDIRTRFIDERFGFSAASWMLQYKLLLYDQVQIQLDSNSSLLGIALNYNFNRFMNFYHTTEVLQFLSYRVIW